MKQEELNKILELHKEWLNDNNCGERANLRYANLRYANLSYADLRYANLSYANLSYADLRYADLRYANLRYADLRYADLRYANLSYANLSYADLRYANLSYADLRSAVGNSCEIKTIQTELYIINHTNNIIQIGCENHTIKEWFEFDDKSILKMDGKKALEWWRIWKPILMQIIDADY